MKGLDLNTTSAGHRPWQEISDPSVAEVASRFGTPPPEYGLILWWGWTAPMTETVITRDLDEIGARGIREDPTHPATAACQHIEAPLPTTQDFLETLDVVGYNCVYRWGDRAVKYYSIDHERYPHRRMIGSEHVSVAGVRGDYSLAERQVGRAGRFRWGPYQSQMLRAEWLWKFSRTYDYVAGDFVWIGIDNLGGVEAAIQEQQQWPDRHVRLPEGRLLLPPKPVDGRTHASPLPTLDLAGSRGRSPASPRLHQLRQRGALREW